MNYICNLITLRVKNLYINWDGCEVLTSHMSISLGCRPGGDWPNI